MGPLLASPLVKRLSHLVCGTGNGGCCLWRQQSVPVQFSGEYADHESEVAYDP